MFCYWFVFFFASASVWVNSAWISCTSVIQSISQLCNSSCSHVSIMFKAYLWKGLLLLEVGSWFCKAVTRQNRQRNIRIIMFLSCVVLLLCCGEHLHAVWQESPERQAGLTELTIENKFLVDDTRFSDGICIWGTLLNVIFVLLWMDLWWLTSIILFMRIYQVHNDPLLSIKQLHFSYQ